MSNVSIANSANASSLVSVSHNVRGHEARRERLNRRVRRARLRASRRGRLKAVKTTSPAKES